MPMKLTTQANATANTALGCWNMLGVLAPCALTRDLRVDRSGIGAPAGSVGRAGPCRRRGAGLAGSARSHPPFRCTTQLIVGATGVTDQTRPGGGDDPGFSSRPRVPMTRPDEVCPADLGFSRRRKG